MLIIDTFEAQSVVRICHPSLQEDDAGRFYLEKLSLRNAAMNLPVSAAGQICLGTCKGECQTHRGMPGSLGKAHLCNHIHLLKRQHGEDAEVRRYLR